MATENGQVQPNKRPKANKFTQQKLDAWQPILTPQWVIGTFLAVAIIFIPVGSTLIWSDNHFEIKIQYDGPSSKNENCIIDSMNEGYYNITRNRLKPCLLNFTIPTDVPNSEDIYIYYELSEFYQNHRRYVQSRSDAQLRNDISYASFSRLESKLSECDPVGSLVKYPEVEDDDENFLFYPCGLIARSYFNEGIQLQSFIRNGEVLYQWRNGIPLTSFESGRLYVDTSNIAWNSDLEEKFRNPTNKTNTAGELVGNAFQYQTYEYLWQTYDQASCYNKSDPSIRLPCLNWTEVAKRQLGDLYDEQVGRPIPGDGCAACIGEEAQLVYEGGIPPPENYEVSTSAQGIRNENFVVWMRIAALPSFRKLYGRLKFQNDTGFEKGDIVSIRIIPNFLVSSFGGTKSLVIGTTSPLGTKNRVLGIAYLTVGTVCITLAVLFFLKLKLKPRKLGDPKYLHWKQS